MISSRLAFPASAALLVLSLVLLLTSGCSKNDNQVGGRGGGGGALPVKAMVVKPRPLEDNIFTTGTLLANEEVELRPEISGRVVGVYFDEGAAVRKGDLLLKINDRELQAELKRKRLEESLSADEERRKKALFDINGISREEYDKVLTAYDMVKAEREIIESQLAETEILAPMNGTVGLRYVSEGSYVTPSSLIATMQNIDTLKVEFSVPEKYTGRFAPGTPVRVLVDKDGGDYQGKIYAVESKVDPATRTLKARAVMANPGRRLLPGAFARVQITLQRIPDAIVVPTGAIVPELDGERVFLYENGKARSVAVTTGIRTDREIQIVEGVKPYDTLIITGLLQVGDGRPVQITGFENDAIISPDSGAKMSAE